MLPSMDKQGFHRRKFYKKLKYQIKLINVEENEIIAEEDITDCVMNTADDMIDEDTLTQVDFLD